MIAITKMTIPICADCGNFIAGKVFQTLSPYTNSKLCRNCHEEELAMTLTEEDN
jgi:recombinational DNA repair protein (RecF pathway)